MKHSKRKNNKKKNKLFINIFFIIAIVLSFAVISISSQKYLPGVSAQSVGEACGDNGHGGSSGTCQQGSCGAGPHGVCGSLCCISSGGTSGSSGGAGNTCTPQGSVGEACGGAGDGSTGTCQDTGSCGGGCHGVCGSLCCVQKSNSGEPAKAGQAFNGEPCGTNGTGICEANSGSCPSGTSSTQTPGTAGQVKNGVCQNLVCCTPAAKPAGTTAAYAGEPCGNNGVGGSAGVCEANSGDCPAGTGTTQTPGTAGQAKNGVCQNLVCCSGSAAKANAPASTTKTAAGTCTPDPSKPAFTSCVLAGQGCTQAANGGVAVGHLALTTTLLNCTHQYTCVDKGISNTCPQPVVHAAAPAAAALAPNTTAGGTCVPATYNQCGTGQGVTPIVTTLYSVKRTCNGSVPSYTALPIAAGSSQCGALTNGVNAAPDGAIFCANGTGTCFQNGCPAGDTPLVNDTTVCSNPPPTGDTGICCVAPVHSTISLHTHFNAIGNGINANGTPENTNPQNKIVAAKFSILSDNPSQSGTPISATDALTYNPKTGDYENPQFSLIALGIIPDGNYKAILHVDKYVNSPVITSPNDSTIPLSQNVTQIPQKITLVPGDLAPVPHGDNIVDIQDYNVMVACMTAADTTACPDPTAADLNGDGVVDQQDLNLLQGNFGALGASFMTPQFMCAQDPSCAKGSNSLQLCPLQCKIENVPGQE